MNKMMKKTEEILKAENSFVKSEIDGLSDLLYYVPRVFFSIRIHH